MWGVAAVYAGLVTAFLGLVSFLKPLKFLGIATRSNGLVVFSVGVVLIAIGFALPAREMRIATPQTQLDQLMPVYQFHEIHTIRVKAPRERVFRAIKEAKAGEITLFRTLTWIRRFGRPEPESILNPSPDKPLLEVAIRTSFLLLAEEADREIVVGTLVMAPPGWRPKVRPTAEGFKALHEPGFALAAMNFRLEDGASGETIVTTETRVFATDAAARRRFACYWRVIYPGSALIRRMWLRAIKRRGETMPG